MNMSWQARSRTGGLLVGLIVAGLVWAAPALGVQDRTLRGAIASSGEIAVAISYHQRDGRTYRRYVVSLVDIPMKCSRGQTVTLTVRHTRQTIRNNAPGAMRFGLGAAGQGSGGARNGWSYRGKLVAPRKAVGTVRAYDTAMRLPNGETDDCRSGRLRWKATG